MSDRSRLRLFVLRVLVVSLLATLFGRLWYLQVMSGDQYRRTAQDLQTRTIVTPAPRGDILDDQGQALVDNKTALVVSVNRTKLARQPDGGKAVLRRLANVTDVAYAELKRRIRLCGPHVSKPCWNGSPYQPIPVAEANNTVALQILEDSGRFPGVSARVQAVRNYPAPAGANAAHLVGHVGTITQQQLEKYPKDRRTDHRNDQVGQAGLELVYDDALSGTPGHKVVSVNHVGSVTGTVRTTKPRSGGDLVTSIDAGAQHDLEKALRRAIKTAHGEGNNAVRNASGVLLDARTGRIVAMANVPSYDPSLWVGGITSKAYRKLARNPSKPLSNLAIQGSYPPGSTFKLVSTSAAVHEGTASLGGTYDCSPTVRIGHDTFHNFESEAFGPIDLHDALKVFCNTVFFHLAKRDYYRDQRRIKAGKKPIEAEVNMAKAYGFDKATGVDLPGESDGAIIGRQEKKRQYEKTYRPNACKGAKNKSFSRQHRQRDAKVCHDPSGGYYLPGDLLHTYIGESLAFATPLQLACAYAALVNGGTVYSPRIGKAVIRPDGAVVKRIKPKVRNHLPVRQKVLDYIKNAMYDVTQGNTGSMRGTASGAFAGFPFGQVAVGGKTGTADVAGHKPTAWFASFAGHPGKRPRYAAVIVVPEGGQGGLTVAPAMRKLWDGVFGVEGAKAALPHGLPPRKVPARGLALDARQGGKSRSGNAPATPHAGQRKSRAGTPTGRSG
jgi:penicillin-binding protein 2